jgi:uncharacterized protein (TIGR02246 family)
MTAVDEIRAADREWMEAFAAGDLDRALAFCAQDCAVLVANAPSAEGPDAIRELFAGWLKPGLQINWKPAAIEASGDLGYSSGTYEMSFRDPTGKTMNDRGKYVIVWKKQRDGSWKVVRDISNSDLPVPAKQFG